MSDSSFSRQSGSETLYHKIWRRHLVDVLPDGRDLLYVDRHMIHEVTSPQAFDGLRLAGRRVRRPDLCLAVADHAVPTVDRSGGIVEPASRIQVETLERNCAESGIRYFPLRDRRQGIVHVVGPEQGFTLPGTIVVCGDSHTATHGAFGALAFGIGTSEVEHVLATQSLPQRMSKTMLIRVDGALGRGVTAKDVILTIIGQIGAAGGNGYTIEYAGSVISDLSMEGRMTICNMSIEGGARAGLMAPDSKTFDYVQGRDLAPGADQWAMAMDQWAELSSDPRAAFDREVTLAGSQIAPIVTWGNSPEHTIEVTGTVPRAEEQTDPVKRLAYQRALAYMQLQGGEKMTDIPIDRVFIGSCTNGRIEDLRAAAEVVRGRHLHERVRGMVVPGSGLVRAQAQNEGLDRIFLDAGFEWREAGCSMCLAMNPDKLSPGERCASTSNRNFEGRQGRGGLTHLVSPTMAVAAGIVGRFVDVRRSDW